MWPEVAAVLDEAVSSGVVPGAALCVRTRDGATHSHSVGHAELRPTVRPVRPGLPWDLASLTKVLCTTSVAMCLVERGILDLDEPIAAHLEGAPRGVTAAHLLHHSSGLPAWLPLHAAVDEAGLSWGSAEARALVLDAALGAERASRPGQRHRYSDLGFLALGALLEAVGGERLENLFEDLVRSPSGADLRWGWSGAAATEDCPVRGRVVSGEVHDLNAACMGGVAAHAGLFGSPEAVARVGAWRLSAHDGDATELSASTVRRFWTARGPGSHRLGWDGVTPGSSSAGPLWPLDGVGHLGFTGCSVWIAPRQGVVVTLCSNRVHPDIEGGAVPGAPITPRLAAFKAFRPAVHTAVATVLGREGSWCD